MGGLNNQLMHEKIGKIWKKIRIKLNIMLKMEKRILKKKILVQEDRWKCFKLKYKTLKEN